MVDAGKRGESGGVKLSGIDSVIEAFESKCVASDRPDTPDHRAGEAV